MNYIKHLNNAMQMFYADDKLMPTHISLYMALFQTWNENRFTNPITFNRFEIMKMAKINSLSTYTKCMRELHEWQYLEYTPSHNPMLGSKVNLYNFSTTDCTSNCTTSRTESVQVSVQPTVQLPYIKKINIINIEKEKKHPPTLEAVLIFFNEKKYEPLEAEKFYNYFQSNGWKVGGKTPMKDWHAAARNWMLNAEKFNNNGNKKQTNTTNAGKLHTTTNKNYDEPL